MNESKARDLHMWAKWEASGAIGNLEPKRKPLMSFNVVETVLNADKLQIAQETARRTGVNVDVIAEGGQSYTTRPSEVWFGDRRYANDVDFRQYTGILPEDKVYIRITGTTPAKLGLTKFWRKYDRLKNAQPST